MAETILLTQPTDARTILTMAHMDRTFPLRLVKGIVQPGSRTLLAPEVKSRRHHQHLREEALHLPYPKAQHLAEFVTRITIAKEPIFTNCHTFSEFIYNNDSVLDAIQSPKGGIGVSVERDAKVAHNSLIAGGSYIINDSRTQELAHSIVGINNPAEHIGVWGDNQPLAIASNADMLEVYEAADILQVGGEFVVKSLAKIHCNS